MRRSTLSVSVLGVVAAFLSGCGDGDDKAAKKDLDPDFSLTASPGSIELVQGQTATSTISVATVDGFDDPINVTVTGLPAGITADPLLIPGGGEAGALVLRAEGTAVQGGPLSLTIHGAAGINVRTTNLSLLVRGPDGTPDTTFGAGDGWLLQDFAGLDDVGHAVLALADGKILVGGAAGSPSGTDFALTRYNADGTLDTAFGSGTGKVTIDMGGTDRIYALALQGDGKILAGGHAGLQFAVARFLADGTLDIGFGSGTGKYYRAIGSNADIYSILVQADGKIILAGSAYVGSDWDFALLRLDTSGELDTDFGPNDTGVITFNFPGSTHDYSTSSVLIPGDKILMCGRSAGDHAFVQLTAAGEIDTGFGPVADPKGWVINPLPGFDEPRSLHVYPDGSILVAGTSDNDFSVARFLADGKIDQSFAGGQGRRLVDIGSASIDELGDMAVLADGSIVLAGKTQNADYDHALVRLTAGGELDLSFGIFGTGRFTMDYGVGDEDLGAVTIGIDGRLLVVGLSATNADGDDILLSRYWL